MPICSYVIHPAKGRFDDLLAKLSSHPQCDVTPSNDRRLMILVTETETSDEETALNEQLKAMEEIECLALAFGHIPQETGGEAYDRA